MLACLRHLQFFLWLYWVVKIHHLGALHTIITLKNGRALLLYKIETICEMPHDKLSSSLEQSGKMKLSIQYVTSDYGFRHKNWNFWWKASWRIQMLIDFLGDSIKHECLFCMRVEEVNKWHQFYCWTNISSVRLRPSVRTLAQKDQYHFCLYYVTYTQHNILAGLIWATYVVSLKIVQNSKRIYNYMF